MEWPLLMLLTSLVCFNLAIGYLWGWYEASKQISQQ